MAKGYVIVNANVTDPEKYAAYRPLAAAAIEAHGGRYLARGGKSETLEGSLPPRGVVIEFDDYETAVKWYHSAGYEAARSVRSGAAEMHMMVVEGV
ncbi:DUF1330 domain-containing protein [Caballeronia sp. M23-90]|jgi:uncharacterized protein (DUF1330 family)